MRRTHLASLFHPCVACGQQGEPTNHAAPDAEPEAQSEAAAAAAHRRPRSSGTRRWGGRGGRRPRCKVPLWRHKGDVDRAHIPCDSRHPPLSASLVSARVWRRSNVCVAHARHDGARVNQLAALARPEVTHAAGAEGIDELILDVAASLVAIPTGATQAEGAAVSD